MAKDSIFSRLKRLFSSSVIVRNVGGRKLKVIDTSSRQMYAQRGARDRYSRIHTKVPYGTSRGDRFAYHAVRVELFRDYDAMDADPIIASALDIYSDESTTKNEYGDILTIKSKNKEVKDVLENLFYDILNIDFNLWPWIRNLCKYGDFFLYLDIHEEFGIVNVVPISVYFVERIEGDEETKNPHKVTFKLDDTFNMYSKRDADFENYEVAHFRLLADSNFLPYGKAMIENARRVWKQLMLMEDAMMIHRITRAPEKRIFKIDIGNIPPNEVDAFMERTTAKMKRAVLIDPQTGEYNLKFNLQNMLEDFYLPVRGSDSGTAIDTTPGLSYEAIDDIEYLRNKLFAALKVPKAFLGYEEGIEGKATLAAEDVRFARTIERIQRIVVSELTKIAVVHLYVQGFSDEDLVSFDLELTNPSTILEQEKINLWAEKMNLANTMKESRIISTDWIYENILNFTTDQLARIRSQVIKDLKRDYRHEQIVSEGNDPAESGEHVESDNKGNGIDKDHPNLKLGGRPDEPGNRDQDKNAFGRDPLGKKTNSGKTAGTADRKIKPEYKGGSPLSFESQAEKMVMKLGIPKEKRGSAENRTLLSEVIEEEDHE